MSLPTDMDRTADFEMPSPKRVRLEAPEPRVSPDPATALDDVDTYPLYGAPPSPSKSSIKNFHDLPTTHSMPSPPGREIFQLPGLGMFNSDISTQVVAENPKNEAPGTLGTSLPLKSAEEAIDSEEQKPQQWPHEHHAMQPVEDSKRIVAAEAPASEAAIAISAPRTSEHLAGPVEPERGSQIRRRPVQEDTQLPGTQSLRPYSESPSPEKALRDGVQGIGMGSRIDTPIESLDTQIAQEAVESLLQEEDEDEDDAAREDHLEGKELGIQAKAHTVRGGIIASAGMSFEELAEINKSNEDAEFELDSSPLEYSLSSDDSSDTSSSEDSDAEDYKMLSPEEQARRLMAEDGGSDHEGTEKERKIATSQLRTLNEKPDEIVPKPDIVVTENMKIEELGHVENIVENLALIRATTSGEYQVLESGSLLCLEDRSVVGVVAETLGRVQQPYYSVRFTNAPAINEAGLEKDTRIFYVEEHSTAVFTQPLKAFKGSDASNLHDEEVGDDEMEFSDDEAEAEHKRQVKIQRIAKRSSRDGQSDRFTRGPSQRRGGPLNRPSNGLPPVQEHPPNAAEISLNYDDADGMNIDCHDEDDGLYTPLARPTNFHDMMAGKAQSSESHANRGTTHRGGHGVAWGSSRSRGGNQRMRGSDRGGKHRGKDQSNRGGKGHPHANPSHRQSPPQTPQQHGFGHPPTNGLPQWPRYQSNGYQPAPLPPRTYQMQPQLQPQPQPQPHAHPFYPFQAPNVYDQSYPQQPQQPQHQAYPPHFPQQQNNPHFQPQFQDFGAYPPYQTPPPPQSQSGIPAGAHINPAFFRQQQTQSSPQAWQQQYQQ